MDNNGIYNFYNGRVNSPVGTHSNYNFDESEYLVIIKGGGAGNNKYGDQIGLGKTFYLQGKNCISNGLYVLKIKIPNILTKYLYHILIFYKNKIMDLATYTTGLGNIKQEILKDFKIPIPPLQVQEEIVSKLDILKEANEMNTKLIETYKNAMKWYINSKVNKMDNILLSNITQFIKPCKYFSQKDNNKDGLYNLYSSSINTIYRINEAIINEKALIINSTNGQGKCIIHYDENFSTTSDTIIIKSKNENEYLIKYIYYFLQSNILLLEKGFKGINHKHISKEYLNTLKIKVSSIEEQNEIITYCDDLSYLIEQLENRNEKNTQLMKDIIESILTY
jgi:restriction endonuclease S subunit